MLSEIIANNLNDSKGRDISILNIKGIPKTSYPFVITSITITESQRFVIITGKPETALKMFIELKELAEFVKEEISPETITLFPPWEILPYEMGSPYIDVMGERLRCLSNLASGRSRVVVTSSTAITQYIIPPNILESSIIKLHIGKHKPLTELVAGLFDLGYRNEDITVVPGTFARRGGIVDVFQPGDRFPVRIEFFGDEIDSIRVFNPTTQSSMSNIKSIDIIPTREAILKGVNIDKALERAGAISDNLKDNLQRILQSPDREDLEPFIPILYESKSTLIDYICDNTGVVLCSKDKILGEDEDMHITIWQRYEDALSRGDIKPPPDNLYTNIDDILLNKSITKRFYLTSDDDRKCVKEIFLDSTEWGRSIRNLDEADMRAREVINMGGSVVVATDSDDIGGIQRTINSLLPNSGRYIKVIKSGVSGGFYIRDIGLALTSTSALFGREAPKKIKVEKRRKAPEGAVPIRAYSNLESGDICVHEDYGIGIFRGLLVMRTEGSFGEYAVIEYKDDGRIYVPVDDTNKVFKYIGSDDKPIIDRLGTKTWERRKVKARERAGEIAEKLVRTYAERKLAKGFAFSPDKPWQYQLEESFEYIETEDQLKTIEDVKRDMERAIPMERLVCGDVGFGKTEVAIRASFKAVLDGKQVAVLVPTTILSAQHLSTFRRRLCEFPVRIEMVSRLNSPSQNRQIIKDLSLGGVDIIIGTHRLLSRDAKFSDLGLVIIDEEHRFGVLQKERLKEIASGVDIITMTATPIPRTLYFALSDIYDISTIGTPPEERQPIYTYIRRFSKDVIRDAITREVHRGGQIYFIHNRVQTIDGIYAMLKDLLPDVNFRVAHGQMDELELAKVMSDFYDGRFDCLISSSIVESGIDNPNVNTIIINRADRFGLSELHQLRGRVGRGGIRAYAYLLISSNGKITKTAMMRLSAVRDANYLGSGFNLALRDLEIRGAGNILGKEQSGHIAQVGFETYMRMIEDEIDKLLGKAKEKREKPIISLNINAFIPEGYIEDQRARLAIYRALADAQSHEEIDEMVKLMLDMYGQMPEECKNLVRIAKIRVSAMENRISLITEKDDFIMIMGEGICRDSLKGRIDGINDIVLGERAKKPFIKFKVSVDKMVSKITVIEKIIKNIPEKIQT
ncbi:MAG: transcription-repair coupling factor [bacterium]